MIVGLPDIIKLFSREGRKFYFFIANTAGYLPYSTKVFHSAFTHRSMTTRGGGKGTDANNERLEFLGDAIIEAVVSDVLYHQYPEGDEGFLSHLRSNMVCRARLNTISFELNLDRFLKITSRKDLTTSHIAGDVLEAFVAAIYLDGGMGRAARFVKKTIASQARIEEALNDATHTNYKSMLVNLGEQNGLEVLFDTRRASEHATDEDGEAVNFVSEVLLADTIAGHGAGRSKKMAEQQAAEEACKRIDSGEISIDEIKSRMEAIVAEKESDAGDTVAESAAQEVSASQAPDTRPTLNMAEEEKERLGGIEVAAAGNAASAATLMAEKASPWVREEEWRPTLNSSQPPLQ